MTYSISISRTHECFVEVKNLFVPYTTLLFDGCIKLSSKFDMYGSVLWGKQCAVLAR